MAAEDAQEAAPRADNQPVLLYGQDVVLAARRMEAAVAPQPRANEKLVQPYKANRGLGGKANKLSQKPSHCPSPLPFAGFLPPPRPRPG